MKYWYLTEKLVKAKNYYSIRAKTYRKIRSFARESEYWNIEQWRDFQWRSIKNILSYSYQWVPYYRQMFKSLGITPDDISSFQDFGKLPILTKDIVRKQPELFFTEEKSKRKEAAYVSTSGSSGVPFGFYSSKSFQAATGAFIAHIWSRIGYTPNFSRVIIRGTFSDSLITRTGRKTWSITSNSISKHNIAEIKEFFEKTKPDFIHAYPSALRIIVDLFKSLHVELKYVPKGLLLGSEKYSKVDRSNFENYFKCKSYSWLGLAEGTILAGECEFDQRYHVEQGYSYVEFEKRHDSQVGTLYNVIGTSFYNYSFPFIRYRCGDVVSISDQPCICKRNTLLIDKVIGRDSDYLIAADGEHISALAILTSDVEESLLFLSDYQFVQKERGKVIVNMRPKDGYSQEEIDVLIQGFSRRAGHGIQFIANICKELEKTSNGKVKFVVVDRSLLEDK